MVTTTTATAVSAAAPGLINTTVFTALTPLGGCDEVLDDRDVGIG
jgi:hypothetical protein